MFLGLAFDDLPAEQGQRARTHLGQCPSCAAEWEAYQRVIRLAHGLPSAPVPPEVSRRVRTALGDGDSQNPEAGRTTGG